MTIRSLTPITRTLDNLNRVFRFSQSSSYRGSAVNLINSKWRIQDFIIFALRGKIDGIWIVSIKLRPEVGHDE